MNSFEYSTLLKLNRTILLKSCVLVLVLTVFIFFFRLEVLIFLLQSSEDKNSLQDVVVEFSEWTQDSEVALSILVSEKLFPRTYPGELVVEVFRRNNWSHVLLKALDEKGDERLRPGALSLLAQVDEEWAKHNLLDYFLDKSERVRSVAVGSVVLDNWMTKIVRGIHNTAVKEYVGCSPENLKIANRQRRHTLMFDALSKDTEPVRQLVWGRLNAHASYCVMTKRTLAKAHKQNSSLWIRNACTEIYRESLESQNSS